VIEMSGVWGVLYPAKYNALDLVIAKGIAAKNDPQGIIG